MNTGVGNLKFQKHYVPQYRLSVESDEKKKSKVELEFNKHTLVNKRSRNLITFFDFYNR